jgi:hypothetical protein
VKGEAEEVLIGSYSEFLAAVEAKSDQEVVESIDLRVEPDSAWADINPFVAEKEGLEVAVFSSGFDDAWIRLAYPFRVSDWEDQLAWLDDYAWAHRQIREACANDVTLSDLAGDGDDVTGEVAAWLGENEKDFADVLGHRWIRVDVDGPQQDVAGKEIHGWFTPDKPSPGVALGFGGNAIYMETVDVSGTSPRTFRIEEEWPVPLWRGPYYEGTFTATQAYRFRDPLAAIREALTATGRVRLNAPAPIGSGGGIRKRGSMDHDVRLSTKNLHIEGIDLDFEVKVDGSVLGTLSVSEGGLLWRPANRQKRYGTKISWTRFAQLVEG